MTDPDLAFKQDVIAGLQAYPKHLSSKYFYDAIGSKIFQEIMALKSYYLTRAEDAVFQHHRAEMIAAFGETGPFNIVEFGAGDGSKTMHLLEAGIQAAASFRYTPIDISPDILTELARNIEVRFPSLAVNTLAMDYFQALHTLETETDYRKVVLFLGSNIGNFTLEDAQDFLQHIRDELQVGDALLLGVDMQKDPQRILRAYNDPEGVTARFNLNLLTRINRELGGDFDLDSFQFHPTYSPQTGEVRSYLLSTKAQTVTVAGHTYEFEAWEPIHTEISRKYRPSELRTLLASAGFKVIHRYEDPEALFSDILCEAV